MGGNDIIVGGGGGGKIWGGPGNDYIEGGKHGELLSGGHDDDVIVGNNSCLPAADSRCGPDFIEGDSYKHADSGDDVLFGGVVSRSEEVYAGPGNDIIVPTVARATGHNIVAGEGNDVVMTLNFSHGMFVDHVNLGGPDGKFKLGIPLGKTCNVTADIDLENPAETDEGEVTCSMPWPRKVSRLDEVIPLTASVDEKGEVSMDATLYNDLANLSISNYRGMTKAQASLGGDVCICDPLMNPAPGDSYTPYDFDTS